MTFSIKLLAIPFDLTDDIRVLSPSVRRPRGSRQDSDLSRHQHTWTYLSVFEL